MARSRGIVVPISAEDNTGRAFENVNAQVAALRAKVAELTSTGAGPGRAIAEGMGHATPQIAAASGAIRELEGNLPIRAIERFLTTTLGLGPALAAAFPLVGAIALGGVVLEGVQKLLKMREAAAQLGQVIDKAFTEAVAKERAKADALGVTNAKLDEQIAKFEKRPADGLAKAAAEARVEIDKLDDDIRSAVAAAKELFDDKNKVTFFDRLTGTQSNEGVKDEVLSTLNKIDAIRKEYSRVVQQAQDDGSTPENIDNLNQAQLAHIQDAYAASTKRLQAQLADARNRQYDSQRLGGSGKEYDPLINSAQGALELYEQQQRTLGQQYQGSVLAPKVARLSADHSNEKDARDSERKAEEARRQKAEADEKAAAAERELADANAKALVAQQKAITDTELDELESRHKALLVSDEEFYRQREAIQAASIQNQRNAIKTQRSGLEQQYAGALDSGVGLTGNDAIANNSKLVELQAKIVELDTKDAALTGQAAKNARDRADAMTELSKRRIADADRAAAQLEGERGGSVLARQQQSKDQYAQQRQAAVVEFGSESAPAVQALDIQQGIDQDTIAARGADQTFASGQAVRQIQRTSIDDSVSRGQTSTQDAQREKIALDREEAAAMQPVLQAYEKLAQDGDLAAIDKVAELQQKIAELKSPINEAAAEVRSQLGNAFESIFENMDRGKKALQELGNMLRQDVLKDSYQAFVQPLVQQVSGVLVPNQAASKIPNGSGLAASIAGIAGKLIPGLGGAAAAAKGGGSGGVTVQIINQTSQPIEQSNASQQGFDSDLEDKVINIVVKNASSGGILSGLLGV